MALAALILSVVAIGLSIAFFFILKKRLETLRWDE